MATVLQAEAVDVGKTLAAGDHTKDSRLRRLCETIGMNPDSTHELERPDIDFLQARGSPHSQHEKRNVADSRWLQEMERLPVNLAQIPHGTDVPSMRRWIDEVLLQGPLAEYRAKVNIKQQRSTADVDVYNVSVPCSDSSNNSFGIRVYEPDLPNSQSKPAVLMFHGGGWIHGNPLGDESQCPCYRLVLVSGSS